MSVVEIEPHGNAAAVVRLPDPAPGIACWTFTLDVLPKDADAREAVLAPDELARASRYGTPALRDRYVAGRATLRALLASLIGVGPAQVPLRRGRNGRPELAGERMPDFNLSHTCGRALLAVVDSGRVGIDLEHEDRVVNSDGLARKFLTERERVDLAELDAGARRVRFLRLWTCKEAMSKATGDALSAPLRELDVEWVPSPRLRRGPPPYGPEDWDLHEVAGMPGFLATVAHWRGPRAAHPAG